MNPDEFIEAMVGVPWVNRASSFQEVDCWGLVILYYKHVNYIDIPEVSGFKDGSKPIHDAFFEQMDSGKWKKSKDGIVFMAFVNTGGVRTPAHCGVRIGDMCLHAQGYEDDKGHHGQVQCTKIHALKRLYKGDMEFYDYIG